MFDERPMVSCAGCGMPAHPAGAVIGDSYFNLARCERCREVEAAWRELIYESTSFVDSDGRSGTRYTKRQQVREIEAAAGGRH